jgi:iron complex outermembrane recepter protein
MNLRSGLTKSAQVLMFIMIALCIGSSALQAQTKQFIAWLDELNYLQNASGDELVQQRESINQIRGRVEFWLKYHPESTVKLEAAPPDPWSADQSRRQVTALRDAVETILKEDPSRPFDMGMTTISVTAESSPLSTIADSFDRNEIINRQALNVATALDYVPGIAIDHATSGRNEASIRLRGFTSKGQIPLYIDGIPVSMPYDGTIDFNRILSNDIAEIQVSKGFSSPLLGANGMGGSINLVTRQPEKKIQADVTMGTGSGDMLLSSVNLGSGWQKFYFQGTFDWLQSSYVPVSGNFTLNKYQPTYERINTDTRDAKYTGRFAWTPKGEDQYVFSYMNQKGEKGVPLYAGPNSAATFNAFSYRRWPYWNKTGYYLITNTGLGETGSIKFRAYYDEFPNEFDFYDDANFSTMNKTTSNHSYYNDHSAGGSAEYSTKIIPHNTLSASFVFRDDNHRETLEYPALSPYPFISPTLLNRAQTFTMGVQDVISLTSRLRATAGFSADYNKGLQIQKLNSTNTALIPVKCAEEPNNTSFTGCTAHVWNYNPQASLSYAFTSLDTLFVTFSDRGRFPLLKEAYSYGLGKGIPNPDLKPEHNTSWNFGYSHSFPGHTVAQIEYFHNRLRDAIQSVFIKDPGGVSAPLCSNTGTQAGYCSQNVNVAKEVHQGFEISVRSAPVSRLTLDVNYSYLNRTLVYDFGDRVDISQVLTAVQILPTYPKNKVIFNAALRLPHEILAIGNFRYEGGIILQDTTYRTAPANLPFATSYGTVDFGGVIPIHAGFSVQAGVRNLFDRNYYYTAGYPEMGRNWYFNARYRF